MQRAVFMFCIIWAPVLCAVQPTVVTFDSRDKLEQGTLENVSIGKDGELRTSPKKEPLFLSNEPFVWDLARDSKGTLYASTGNHGRIYKITGADTSLFYESEKLTSYAMAIDKKDNLFIGTSPDGSIIKITPEGKPLELFKPESAYIWDLKIAANGSIWAATGDTARILHISPKGDLIKTYTPDVRHVRCLYLYDNKVYAGTSGDGHIYRIDNDRLFVLFDTMMEEVIDLFVAGDHMIYAAAMSKTVIHPFAVAISDENEKNNADATAIKNGVISPQLSSVTTSLFRIGLNGYGKDLWQSSDQVIQSIAPLKQDVLIGTGEEGRCYRMNSNGDKTLLYQMDEAHITALLTFDNDVFIGTSNLGRIYQLEDQPAKQAIYLSKPIDSDVSARWGTLQWESLGPEKSISFYTRSGNTQEPGKAWSAWQKVGAHHEINSPESRFLQWKVELTHESAVVEKVEVSYLQDNLEPEILTIFLHSHNTFFKHEDQDKSKGLQFPKTPSEESEKQGFRCVEWQFHDPNYDGLLFEVYYQKKHSSHWRKMTNGWALNYYSWDTHHMSDGRYRLKISASDEPDNPSNLKKTTTRVSEYFLVDNTPPRVYKTLIHDSTLSFNVKDEWSRIKNVWYSMNARDWQPVYPDDAIADSKTETYKVHLCDPHSDIAVKVQDELGNVNVYPLNE